MILFFFGNQVSANINMTVSPIKYEIEAFTGTTITKTAKLYNYSSNTYAIELGKSDFTAGNKDGKPRFVTRRSELVFPDQQLSTWITINSDDFIIGPNEEKEITFTIDIPWDATPGGHYGAVFFKKHNSTDTNINSASNIGVNIDYGVLILVNVDGEIVTDAEVDDIIVHWDGGWWGGWASSTPLDSCPLWDFSYSNYDGKCYDNPFQNEITDKETPSWSGSNTPIEDETDKENEENKEFDITFEVPFINKWNTHLKPEWEIKLIDEDGKQIGWVGKKVIADDNGIIIGEEIVDYLPINDIGWNVLPNSQRDFQSQWKGFPYEAYDESGNRIIKYWSPSEYYTLQNQQKQWFVMFWERVLERKNTEKITAEFSIKYKDKDGEDIQFNSAKEFDIEYTEKYIGLNYYVCIPLWILTAGLFIFFLIVLKRRRKCPNCKETVKKKMKVCPYCGEKLKKKKKKKKS